MEATVRRAIVTESSSEPITTAEARKQCDIGSSDTTHDTFLDSLITAARQKWERDTDQVVMSSTVVEKFDDFACDELRLCKRPVTAVTSVQYVDTNGSTQTWSSGNYALDTYRPYAAIVPAYNVQWPNTLGHNADVTVTYVAGYANAAAVPKLWKQAMLLLVSHWFENRSSVNIGNIVNELPHAYERLIANFQRSSYP